MAIAAAEMVATINGHPPPPPPLPECERALLELDYESGDREDAMAWIAWAHPAADPHLTDLARQAVPRVTGPESDIAGRWFEDVEPRWRAFMAGLAASLAD